MKRIILCISMLFMVMVFTHAQEKANVLVENFTAEGGYTDSDVRTLRENVIRALIKTMRVNVLDAENSKATDKQYTLVKGHLQKPAVSSQTVEDKGERFTLTEVNLNYVITMIKPNSKESSTSFMFTTRGNSMSGEADAIADACKMVKLSMTKMMEKVFPVVGKIVLIDNAKDDKALTVYINLGASNGIKKGQKFDVAIMKDVAGEQVSKNIGTLTATEVSDTKTLCKVNSGEVDIFSSVNSGIDTAIKTREKKGLLKGLGDVMGNVYGGSGFIADSGMQVENSTENTVSAASVSGHAGTAASGLKTGSASKFSYYDFISGPNGRKYIEPILDWSANKATIIAYMKEADYVKSDDDMLAFASDDDDDPHSPSIMYMIMNGQYFSATSMLMQVKKESVLTWMKQHYIYKGKTNGGLADLHNFISKDKKTSIMVSFMNLNESEYSTVTIAYQKEF